MSRIARGPDLLWRCSQSFSTDFRRWKCLWNMLWILGWIRLLHCIVIFQLWFASKFIIFFYSQNISSLNWNILELNYKTCFLSHSYTYFKLKTHIAYQKNTPETQDRASKLHRLLQYFLKIDYNRIYWLCQTSTMSCFCYVRVACLKVPCLKLQEAHSRDGEIRRETRKYQKLVEMYHSKILFENYIN